MTPATRERLLAQLKQHEGLRLSAYRDTEGFWTVGYGHNMDADATLTGSRRASIHRNGITKAEALAFLQDDIEHAIRELAKHLPWCNRLDEVRQAVMVELCFNMGIGRSPGHPQGAKGLKSFANSLVLIERGQYAHAAENLRRSKWALQVRAGRAGRIADELESGRWPPMSP